MTHRGPFQPPTFCDSVKSVPSLFCGQKQWDPLQSCMGSWVGMAVADEQAPAGQLCGS